MGLPVERLLVAICPQCHIESAIGPLTRFQKGILFVPKIISNCDISSLFFKISEAVFKLINVLLHMSVYDKSSLALSFALFCVALTIIFDKS